jgi:hypothetical protein
LIASLRVASYHRRTRLLPSLGALHLGSTRPFDVGAALAAAPLASPAAAAADGLASRAPNGPLLVPMASQQSAISQSSICNQPICNRQSTMKKPKSFAADRCLQAACASPSSRQSMVRATSAVSADADPSSDAGDPQSPACTSSGRAAACSSSSRQPAAPCSGSERNRTHRACPRR